MKNQQYKPGLAVPTHVPAAEMHLRIEKQQADCLEVIARQAMIVTRAYEADLVDRGVLRRPCGPPSFWSDWKPGGSR